MAIRHCEITQPPTAAELEEQLHAAMGRSALSVIVREMRDIPPPQDEAVTFWVDRATFEPLPANGMHVVGLTPDGGIVAIDTNKAGRDQPAQIDIVTPDPGA